MWAWRLSAVLLLGWPAWAASGQNPQPGKEKNVAEQANEIEAAYRKKIEPLAKRLQDASDEKERGKLVEELLALQKKAAQDLLKLARGHVNEPEGLTVLKKVVANGTNPETQKEAAELILAHYVTSAGVGEEAATLVNADPKFALKFARAILDRNPNRNDKGIALFAIGFVLKQQAIAAQNDEAKCASLLVEAKKALETAKQDYADVKVGDSLLRTVVQNQLAGLNNIGQLIPGKPAPDIVGEDLSGKSFKLSDYRGKVVLLDFWAHW